VVEPPPDPVVGGGEGEGEGEGEDEGEPAETDPWAPALDVEQMIVRIDAPAPAGYPYPRVGTGFSLGGTEFWQKWAEGHNPTYSYGAGTEEGKRCMVASAMRFEAIMAEPPAALVALRDDSDWGGSFFNWNDDYSNSTSGDASSSVLWAWRTHLIKWISQTSRDGACYLPTRALVVAAAEACARRAAADGGAIQGCQARP